MQETILEQDINNMDLSNVAALQQKRTLAFVNHFVISTVQFLNSFMKSCEQKLMQFEQKLEKVNATIVLLETKLSSIPEINNTPTETKDQSTPEKSESEKTSQPTKVDAAEVPVHQPEDAIVVKPEYEKFIKMVQVGVPLDAVKLKITLEGLDSQELDRILKK